jgi:holo-[acyl-carrier protein] synthase
MDIAGIGTQVMECVRVRKLIDTHGEVFLRQVYTERETQQCNARKHSTEQFTAVWAAKEAVLRSLGTTWRRGVAWTDIEILCENGSPPTVSVTGATAQLLTTQRIERFLLTIAHCRAFATATSIAIHDPDEL